MRGVSGPSRVSEARQSRSISAGFDREFLPAEQLALESAVAERRSVWGKHDECERLGNGSLVDRCQFGGGACARVGVIEHSWRRRSTVVDGRLEPALRRRRVVR